MKLLRAIDKVITFPQGTVATIGNFDGVHRGHQALLAALKLQAAQTNLPLIVLLFEPQPGEYFQGKEAPARLSSLREKLELLKKLEVDYVYCLKFDANLAAMPAEQFAENYIFSLLKAKYLLVGEDFRFGQGRQGDLALLKQLGEEKGCFIQSFSDFSLENTRVSSTKIRQALKLGKLKEAYNLLGRNYSICGRVKPGDGRGRQWGIPTANLNLARQTLALTGVFCVRVRRESGQWFQGVANLGTRPSVDGSKVILEINLFNFDDNLYGERLEVFFLDKLRDEIKFSSIDALIAQIKQDINEAKLKFAHTNLTIE